MKTIWKYPVPLAGEFSVDMPAGARIVEFGRQGGDLFVWAVVDDRASYEVRYFEIVGTGHPVPEGEYVGTVHAAPFVWHLFEVQP